MNKIEFIDKHGQKRKGIKAICPQCNVEFITREDQPQKYCGKPCYHLAKKAVEKVTKCAWCGTEFARLRRRLRGSKSGLFFCDRQCKENAQKIGGIEAIMPSHYKNGEWRVSYRDNFLEDELVCARCGYKEFKGAVDIHHIDENRANNDRKNLIPLCACCHRALHLHNWDFGDLGVMV